MENAKRLFVIFRNALAFSFAWLVLCAALVSLFGDGILTAGFLFKILALCAWGSLCFVFSFCTKFMSKRGFIFCLTVFFALFIPVEVLMFYLMGIFAGFGTPVLWITLGLLIAVCYVTCVVIDLIVMRRRGREYTAKLMEYNSKKAQ
ncbi:MAG: hypothetical protein K6E12_05965 [Saccharofermentans sp.]|nr:hypothetical protein [Saccharofermentans sp.]